MEGAVAVMEGNPRLLQNIIALCALRIHEAIESSGRLLRLRDDMRALDERLKRLRMMLARVDEPTRPIHWDTAEQNFGEVEFSKGGFDIKMGSHTQHAWRCLLEELTRFNEVSLRFISLWPESIDEWATQPIFYCNAEQDSGEVNFSMMPVPKYVSTSARHPLVYMMLFARNLLDHKSSCPKSTVPRSLLHKTWRSRPVSRGTGISEEDEDAIMGESNMESVALLQEQKELVIISSKNGSDNYTGHMEGVSEVTRTKPDRHSIMEEAVEEKTAATWVVATAAAHHATGNRNLLSGFTPDQPGRFVESADGAAPMQVLGHGSVITDMVVLPDVLYVPGLTANLVSASQLAELDYTVGFSRGGCHIRSAADGTIVGKGSVGEDGLFELDFLKVLPAI